MVLHRPQVLMVPQEVLVPQELRGVAADDEEPAHVRDVEDPDALAHGPVLGAGILHTTVAVVQHPARRPAMRQGQAQGGGTAGGAVVLDQGTQHPRLAVQEALAFLVLQPQGAQTVQVPAPLRGPQVADGGDALLKELGGLLVVAVDLTLGGEAPYPACVQDANYAARWLKVNAARWNGDVSKLGIYGSSSGGHVAELLSMRPHDPRYTAIPLAGASGVDATVSWVAMRSPPSDTLARYQNAVNRKNEAMIKNNTVFFVPWDSIHEGNPRAILARKEKVRLVPFLIMQGGADDNVLPEMQKEFCQAYRDAGGACERHAAAEQRAPVEKAVARGELRRIRTPAAFRCAHDVLPFSAIAGEPRALGRMLVQVRAACQRQEWRSARLCCARQRAFDQGLRACARRAPPPPAFTPCAGRR